MLAAKPHSVWLYLIITGYFILGTIYIVMNPLWEAPDEIHHFSMVQYLQSHQLQLPSQEPGTVGLWQQEGNQPPLYYLLGALLISPINTSDIETVMRINPHADIGIIRPDGNVNRIVHHPSGQFPGSGAVLATYILRFFSLILGGCTVYVTYCIGHELFPDNPSFALTAAGLNAFLPMYVYISASVNNDNLSNLLANLLVLLLIRLSQVKQSPSLHSYALIGIVTGAGLLSKLNIGFLIPVVALVLLMVSTRMRDWKPFIIGAIISGGLTIALAGWWYYRNWVLFSDPTALDRFLDIVGRRAIPADLSQLWTEHSSFIRTFWGLFGSINVPMPETLYIFFTWLTKFCLLSLVVFLALRLRAIIWRRESGAISGKQCNMLAIGIALLWPMLTFIALLRWTSITPASQGRLVYGAISSVMLWMAVALLWWIPQKWRGWIGGLWTIGLATIAALQPFTTIAPAYALPETIQTNDITATYSFENNQIALHGVEILTPRVTPDSYVEVSVEFEALTTFDQNWSIFVHLVTEDEIIIGQRDVYPGQGLLATSDLEAGYVWENSIAIFVPPTAYNPNVIDVRMGWYNFETGQRMALEDGSEMRTIGQVDIVPRNNAQLPNPLDINFGNQIQLVGYDINTLTPMQGEIITLTLYWKGLQPIEQDYVVFAHIIDPQTSTKYADSNAMPAQWTRPTSTWNPDEVIEDTHMLTISENAVPGVYPIEVGLYLQEDGYPRLGVMGTYDTFVYLTPLRIESDNE